QRLAVRPLVVAVHLDRRGLVAVAPHRLGREAHVVHDLGNDAVHSPVQRPPALVDEVEGVVDRVVGRGDDREDPVRGGSGRHRPGDGPRLLRLARGGHRDRPDAAGDLDHAGTAVVVVVASATGATAATGGEGGDAGGREGYPCDFLAAEHHLSSPPRAARACDPNWGHQLVALLSLVAGDPLRTVAGHWVAVPPNPITARLPGTAVPAHAESRPVSYRCYELAEA